MLTARNAILTWIVLLAISVAWSAWSMLRPPDSGGFAADSYGTRWQGHRAILESLQELNVPVKRSLGPPQAASLGHATLVLWDPNPDLVQVEGTWLKDVAGWVRSGGRVVVAMSESSISVLCASGRCKPKKDDEPSGTNDSITAALGLPDVSVVSSRANSDESRKSSDSGNRPFEDIPDLIRKAEEHVVGKTCEIKRQVGQVSVSGDWSQALESVKQLTLPAGRCSDIVGGESQRLGHVTLNDAFGEHCVAASFRVGEGEIICVSIPELTANGCVGETDNAILAASLMAAGDRTVVFDEFFHGLSVRGNPMWLFAQRTYGSIAISLLLLIGLWAWRQAIRLGPPLAYRKKNRRTVGEYIDAMSRFLLEASEHQRYLARQVRDGVMWQLKKEFHLPPDSDDREPLFTVMRRREPGRVAELQAAVSELDFIVSSPGGVPHATCEAAMKRITACL